MLQQKFEAIEKQMKAQLDEIRATFTHRGDKGSSAEAVLREFLRRYLPRRLAVGHGEVVDTFGTRSHQTDVVVANEDHPFTFSPDEPGLFFVEGVSAVGEVKAMLTQQHLSSTLENAKMFKSLRSHDPAGTFHCSNAADFRRFYSSSPYFLFAFESELSMETLLERLRSAGGYSESPPCNGLDAVFLLDRGSIIDFGAGDGALCCKTASGESAKGWAPSDGKDILFDLMGWLCGTMPRRVRTDPILMPYLLQGRAVPKSS